MKWLHYLITIFVLCNTSYGQLADLSFQNFTSSNGLSNNQINCIHKDHLGFIWLGTNDGLNRFDGSNFEVFKNLPGDNTSLSGNIIKKIVEDKEHNLWIATEDGGLTKYDYRLSKGYKFKQFKHIPSDKNAIPVNAINDMVADNDGNLWLATRGAGVLKFNIKDEKFDLGYSGKGKTALSLCLVNNSNIWVGRQGGGLAIIDPQKKTISYNKEYDNFYLKLPHMAITCLAEMEDDHVWFGSWDKTINYYHKQSNINTPSKLLAHSKFKNDIVNILREDSQGNIWMGGQEHGVQQYNVKTKTMINIRHEPQKYGSLLSNYVNDIFIDNENRVWIATRNGLSVYSPVVSNFKQTFLSSNLDEQITIYDIDFSDKEKTVFGTNKGLFNYYNKTGTINYEPIVYEGEKLSATCFFKDSKGVNYIGTNRSLFIYNKGRLSLLPNTESDKVMNKIISSRVVDIYEDTINQHRCLVVFPYGHYLAYYDFIEKKWYSRLTKERNIIGDFGLEDNLIRMHHKTSSGSGYFALGKDGLAELKDNKVVKYHKNSPLENSISNNNVVDILQNNGGDLFVSTNGGGINKYASGKFFHISSSPNLTEGINLDADGNLWMISNGNLHKLDQNSMILTSFKVIDQNNSGGVRGNLYKDRFSQFYACGNNFFIKFEPTLIKNTSEKLNIEIVDFKIFNHSESQLLSKEKISLKHNQNVFRIDFAAPKYEFQSPTYFAYKMEGVSEDWVDIGGQNFVTFSNLSAGDYVFNLRATDKPGTWTECDKKLNIRVSGPFWKQWWFICLMAVALTAIIYGLYLYRIHQLTLRHKIRDKISQDLHDNVGSTLGSIAVFSKVAQIYQNTGKDDDLKSILLKINNTCNDTISDMNDIVWSINPNNDSMEKVVSRMKTYAQELLLYNEIKMNFTVDEALYKLHFEMTKRKNAYLIFKEALNNIVKYAKASEVNVSIIHQNQHLILKVEDNGVGFDVVNKLKNIENSLSGNGIKNMQKRAKESDGSINFESNEGKGTILTLTMPIT